MKNVIKIATCIFLCILLMPLKPEAADQINSSLELTKEETEWLSRNKDRVFVLGIDPYSGMEYFTKDGEEKGYVIPLIKMIMGDLGLQIKLEATKNWGEVYSGLQTGSVDILLGANETPERKKFMTFTRPINQNAYAIMAQKASDIHTIGDVDDKIVGFMNGDFVIDQLPSLYKNIKYEEKLFPSQEEGVTALNNGEIDAFIMPGGSIVYDYMYRFPDVKYAFRLYSVTSDMTLSTRKTDEILTRILDKEIQYLEKEKLPKMIRDVEVEYNLKILKLTPEELHWLKNDGRAVAGIIKDYLPFDYYDNGVYKGISAEVMGEISKMTGIEFDYMHGDFDFLYQNLKLGEIDVLNIAKTKDRMRFVLYPRPYCEERDIIIGRKESKEVRDIFGLEGCRVAVIKGYWHREHLLKNLTKVKLIETSSIQESLKLVNRGDADYLIENPIVAKYYMEELRLYDLIEKGITSTDSYLYYGINKSKPQLASIIDKVIPLMDINELSKNGYEEVPHLSDRQYYRNLIIVIIGLGILLLLIIAYVAKLVNALIKEKTETELLRQREHFLYTDALTNVYNRNYFNRIVKETANTKQLPQTIIIADMNNLKVVNDTYGHHIGDELLRHFAALLKEVCPEKSLIFRIGGDEFLIFLEDAGEIEAELLTKSIKKISEEKDISLEANQIIYPMVALGFATRYCTNENIDDLMKTADLHMYCDKQKHRILCSTNHLL